MSDCECPYCKKAIDDPDDAYDQDEEYEYECPYCGKYFMFTVDYIRTYSTHKADCLNEGEHDYKKTTTIPAEFARMKCTMCVDEIPIVP